MRKYGFLLMSLLSVITRRPRKRPRHALPCTRRDNHPGNHAATGHQVTLDGIYRDGGTDQFLYDFTLLVGDKYLPPGDVRVLSVDDVMTTD